MQSSGVPNVSVILIKKVYDICYNNVLKFTRQVEIEDFTSEKDYVVKLIFDSNFSILFLCPVEKLSKQTTWYSFDKKYSHKLEPIKPAPPVTRIRLPFNIFSC